MERSKDEIDQINAIRRLKHENFKRRVREFFKDLERPPDETNSSRVANNK